MLGGGTKSHLSASHAFTTGSHCTSTLWNMAKDGIGWVGCIKCILDYNSFNLWCVSQDVTYYKLMGIFVHSDSIFNICPPLVWSVWLWTVSLIAYSENIWTELAEPPMTGDGSSFPVLSGSHRSPRRSSWVLESLWGGPFFCHPQFLLFFQFSRSQRSASELLAFTICGLIILLDFLRPLFSMADFDSSSLAHDHQRNIARPDPSLPRYLWIHLMGVVFTPSFLNHILRLELL